MSKISIKPSSTGTGTYTIEAPTGNLSKTLMLPDVDGTLMTVDEKITIGTAKDATGTSVDFTGIPSWAKRITVMFDGVSTNGTAYYSLKVRANNTVISSGYKGSCGSIYETENIQTNSSSSDIPLQSLAPVAASAMTGSVVITKMKNDGTLWSYSGINYISGGAQPLMNYTAGVISLSNILDGVRMTTSTGVDQLDAGTINISWE